MPNPTGQKARVCFKKATADVGVRVRRTVVVHVERPVVLVLVIVTAMVQARVTTVKVPVIRDIVCYTVDPALSLYQKKAFYSSIFKWGVFFMRYPIGQAFSRHFEFLEAESLGEGTAVPSPQTPSSTGEVTPPSAGVPGGDSRCWCTCSTHCRSSRRTARGPGPGYSYRHGAGTGHYRQSPSYPGHKCYRCHRW